MQRHDRPSFGLIHTFLSILFQHVLLQNDLLSETLLGESMTNFGSLQIWGRRTWGVMNWRDVASLFWSWGTRMIWQFICDINLKKNNKVFKSFYIKLTSKIIIFLGIWTYGLYFFFSSGFQCSPFLYWPLITAPFSVFKTFRVSQWMGTSNDPYNLQFQLFTSTDFFHPRSFSSFYLFSYYRDIRNKNN